MSSEIKNSINYYIQGLKGLAKAKISEITEGVVSEEIQEFRKSQCLSCPLFNSADNTCNRNLLSDGEQIISIDRVYNGEFEPIKVNGVIRQTTVNGKIFTVGCGCKLWDNKPQKIKYHFTEEELNKKDGTAPCPLNKWTKDEYNKYIKNISTKSGE